MRFEVAIGKPRSAAQRTRHDLMRILIVGDVMGASAAEAPPVDQRPIVGISVDAFDDVFARYKPSVALPALGLQAPLALDVLDDFHPDKLFQRVGIFDRLRALRQRLQRPSTFAAAAYELKSDAPGRFSRPSADSGPVPAATLELEYRRGDQSLRYAFNASNFELLHELSPLMQQLDRLGGALLAHPERSISVAVVRTGAGFELVLKNVGNGPVMVADPRVSTTSTAASRCVVGVAMDQDEGPGFHPSPEFTSIPLKPSPAGAAAVVLAAGQSLNLETVPWSPPAPGRYLANAGWTDYAGPAIDSSTVMPMIPDPGGEQGDRRPYLIRGAAFSSYLQFTVK